MNEFERAEVRALASLLENWPTGEKTRFGSSDDGVAHLDSPSEKLLSQLRARSGDSANEWLSVEGAGRILGSVANSVAHRAPCDVYIVKTV